MNSLKRAVFESAICKGMVAVHVAPADGLALPCDPPCILHYGFDLPRPIPDLDIGPLGIRATLSFSCQPVETFVPWEAVVALALKSPLFIAQWPEVGEVAEGPVEPQRKLRTVD